MSRADDLSDWLIVVPARLGSERLPRKPLADLGGRPLVVRVAENLAPLTRRGATLVVATDAPAVLEICTQHGVRAMLTRATHASGTDRCAEAASAFPHSYVLNVQGDEPFVAVADLEALTRSMVAKPEADMGTLVYRSTDPAVAADPNAVKAVRTQSGWALYFSRASLPYDRSATARGHRPEAFWQHLGVYAFRREKLADFVRLGPSPLELTEKLEQLRALEAGWRLWTEEASTVARGIDTPEDLEMARARLK